MNTQQKILAAVGVICAIIGMIYYSTNAVTSHFKFDPEKAFNEAFDEDFKRIEGPLDIKTSDTSYDIWMHFKYPHEAKMKHESEFQPAWVAEAAMWFTSRVPDASGLKDINHIKFRRRINNQTTMVTNEWIIYNPRTDEHFYRTWGTSR